MCFITYVGGNEHSHHYKHCLSKLKQQGVISLDYEIDDCNMKQTLFLLSDLSYDAYIYEKN